MEWNCFSQSDIQEDGGRKIACSEIQSSVVVGKGGVYLTDVLLSRVQYRI